MILFARLRDIVTLADTYRRLKARDRWSRERMRRYQERALHAMVRHAVTHSHFYRELYGTLGHVRLEELPVIDKRTVMENFDRLVTDPRLKLTEIQSHLQHVSRDELLLDEYRAMTTAGSSGLTGVFVYNRREWSHVVACMLRGASYLGVGVRVPRRVKIAAIGAHSPVHMTYRAARSFDMGLHRMLRLPATLPVSDLAKRLDAFRPEVIQGYPSIIALLAVEQVEGRLSIRPRVISTGSEVLTEEMAEQIQQAWGIQAFNGYGTTEGVFGAECSLHQGIHLFKDLTMVEVVDEQNQPVPEGVPGHRLLITNLFNFTQPLIRYEITDMVTMGEEPCREPGGLILAVKVVE
jgi:phenylacetate-coenzyme A ligase PaaK-like adenylate-forming protein